MPHSIANVRATGFDCICGEFVEHPPTVPQTAAFWKHTRPRCEKPIVTPLGKRRCLRGPGHDGACVPAKAS